MIPPQFLLMRLPSFPTLPFPNHHSSAPVHPLDSRWGSITPSPEGPSQSDRSFSPIPAPFWRTALWGMERGGEQLAFESYQPLHLMSCLNIVSCPAYVTSPQGKGHASTCPPREEKALPGLLLLWLWGVSDWKTRVETVLQMNGASWEDH